VCGQMHCRREDAGSILHIAGDCWVVQCVAAHKEYSWLYGSGKPGVKGL
jgi:hypothetical protein